MHTRSFMHRGHCHGFTKSSSPILTLHRFYYYWMTTGYWIQLNRWFFFIFSRSISSCMSIAPFSISDPNKAHLVVDTPKVNVRSFWGLSSEITESRSEGTLEISLFSFLIFQNWNNCVGQATPLCFASAQSSFFAPTASLTDELLLSLHQKWECSVTGLLQLHRKHIIAESSWVIRYSLEIWYCLHPH